MKYLEGKMCLDLFFPKGLASSSQRDWPDLTIMIHALDLWGL